MLRPARALALLAAMAAAALPARDAAGQAAPGPVQILEAMPQELAGFMRFGQLTDFEARPNGAGLGASIEFRDPETRAIGTVYVYGRGQKGLVEGAGSPAVEQELAIAGQEIERTSQARNYTIGGRSRAADLPGGGKPPALRCDAYVISFASGNTSDSYACVGVRNGRFLKLRFTVSRQSGAAPEPLLIRCGNAVLAAMRNP